MTRINHGLIATEMSCTLVFYRAHPKAFAGAIDYYQYLTRWSRKAFNILHGGRADPTWTLSFHRATIPVTFIYNTFILLGFKRLWPTFSSMMAASFIYMQFPIMWTSCLTYSLAYTLLAAVRPSLHLWPGLILVWTSWPYRIVNSQHQCSTLPVSCPSQWPVDASQL